MDNNSLAHTKWNCNGELAARLRAVGQIGQEKVISVRLKTPASTRPL